MMKVTRAVQPSQTSGSPASASPTLPPSHNREDRLRPDVALPEGALLGEGELFIAGNLPELRILRRHLLREGRLSTEAVMRLLTEARNLMVEEPNLLDIPSPVTIVGDLHGQFYDMMTAFDVAGSQPSRTSRYLFLGDYVDRGSFSCEVVLYLCACKLNFPDSVFMLRGNHEARDMNTAMTFRSECVHKYGADVFDEFELLFMTLPLAAVVRGTPRGDCFCVHGGLSPALHEVGDINDLNRVVDVPDHGLMCDLLWSDPFEDWDPSGFFNYFVFNDLRETSCKYSATAVHRFLMENDLAFIVRAHQVQEEGYKEHYKDDDNELEVAPVLTVFSAPNYCDSYGNRASVLMVSNTSLEIRQFFHVPHPYCLPGCFDSFSYFTPLIFEHVIEIVHLLEEYVLREGEISDTEKEADEALAAKLKKLCEKNKRLREQRDQFRVEVPARALSIFEQTRIADRSNEARPKPGDKFRLGSLSKSCTT
eukprot:m51a1_g12247 hypothetical protein (479) ;mRNA; f:144236-146385